MSHYRSASHRGGYARSRATAVSLPRRRQGGVHAGPLVAFLLIASFGILFAGCSNVKGPEEGAGIEDITFTEDDVARFRELAGETRPVLTGSGGERIDANTSSKGSQGSTSTIVVDLSNLNLFRAIRAGSQDSKENFYRVTNEFLNVRSEPRNSAGLVERLTQGTLLTVNEFVNAGWAKVTLANGKTGFVALQYIGKLTTDEELEKEKKGFEGMYYVSFAFVNVRSEPSQSSEKLGEIPGETFVRPISIQGEWARVPFEGKEGFVSTGYLSPFLPTYLVRQETYTLPILHYHLSQEGALANLEGHVARLRADSVRLITLGGFAELLRQQESRDVRLEPRSAVIAISGVTPDNAKDVSDLLSKLGLKATVFIESQHIGLSGITEKTLLTMMANGADIQSAGHTGDDLRSLTNAQIDLELRQSRKILEDATKTSIIAVGYPQGGQNDRVIQKADEAGYLFGVGSKQARTVTRTELLQMPSYAVGGSMTADEASKIALGQ